MTIDIENYAIALIIEEAGELIQDAAKSLRFGVDSPAQPKRKGEEPHTARDDMNTEMGDLLAAYRYSCEAGLLDPEKVEQAASAKWAKLIDPLIKDNLGRRIAPALPSGDT